MIGRLVSDVASGRMPCQGAFDKVTEEHVGPRPGVEATGWAWDVNDGVPIRRLLFVDSGDRIVGAGEGGYPRPDVAHALAIVTSPDTGWRGEIGARSGTISVMGLTAHDSACDIASRDIGGSAAS